MAREAPRAETSESFPVLTLHIVSCSGQDLLLRDQHEIDGGLAIAAVLAKTLTQEALRAVPLDGGTELAARDEPEAILSQSVGRGDQHEQRSIQAKPRAEGAPEGGRGAQARAGPQACPLRRQRQR